MSKPPPSSSHLIVPTIPSNESPITRCHLEFGISWSKRVNDSETTDSRKILSWNNHTLRSFTEALTLFVLRSVLGFQFPRDISGITIWTLGSLYQLFIPRYGTIILYIALFPELIVAAFSQPEYRTCDLVIFFLLVLERLTHLPSSPANLLYWISWEPANLFVCVLDIVDSLTGASLTLEEEFLATIASVFLLRHNISSPQELFLVAFTFGALFCIFPSTPFLRKSKNAKSEHLYERWKCAILVYGIFAFNILVFLRPWIANHLNSDPILWMIFYMFKDPGCNTRLSILAYWTALILGTVFMVDKFFLPESSCTSSILNLRRKSFHLLVTVLFLPTISVDKPFTFLALSLALFVFVFTELLRITHLLPFSERLNIFLQHFTDERDHRGPLIISHIYLLLGCSLPIFLSMYSKQDFEIDGYVGILSLGLGDSMASIFGKLFGRRKWFLTKKTAEGTFAFILFVLLGSWLVVAMQWTTLGSAFWKYVMVVVLTGIYEGISEQNDNIMVPLIFWAGTQAIRR